MDKGAGDMDPSEYDDEGDGVDLLEWKSTSPPERMASMPNLRLHIVFVVGIVICLFHFGDLMVNW